MAWAEWWAGFFLFRVLAKIRMEESTTDSRWPLFLFGVSRFGFRVGRPPAEPRILKTMNPLLPALPASQSQSFLTRLNRPIIVRFFSEIVRFSLPFALFLISFAFVPCATWLIVR